MKFYYYRTMVDIEKDLAEVEAELEEKRHSEHDLALAYAFAYGRMKSLVKHLIKYDQVKESDL